MQISSPIQPENSGGPVLYQNGEVAGVVTSTLNTLELADLTGTIPQNLKFAIRPELVRLFLVGNGVGMASSNGDSMTGVELAR